MSAEDSHGACVPFFIFFVGGRRSEVGGRRCNLCCSWVMFVGSSTAILLTFSSLKVDGVRNTILHAFNNIAGE